jgi:hypothetical protein
MDWLQTAATIAGAAALGGAALGIITEIVRALQAPGPF